MNELLLKEESFRIFGACMEVYNEMGFKFLDAVYQECLGYEFDDSGIECSYSRSKELAV